MLVDERDCGRTGYVIPTSSGDQIFRRASRHRESTLQGTLPATDFVNANPEQSQQFVTTIEAITHKRLNDDVLAGLGNPHVHHRPAPAAAEAADDAIASVFSLGRSTGSRALPGTSPHEAAIRRAGF